MWPFSSTPTATSASGSGSTSISSQPPAGHPSFPPSSTEAEASADKCPVDHSTRAAWLQAQQNASSPFYSDASSSLSSPSSAPSTSAAPTSKFTPISTASAGKRYTPGQAFVRSSSSSKQDSTSSASASSSTMSNPKVGASWQTEDGEEVGPSGSRASMPSLSTQRVISSIPRQESSFTTTPPGETPPAPTSASASTSSSTTPPCSSSNSSEPNANTPPNWVYPSEQQFFQAMLRKNHKPNPVDMKTIVPIHNMVNEKAWQELLKWEKGRGGEGCGGVKLVSFKGRPKDRTPKAWLNVALGYTAPFDRHDWVINRCGTEVRYVIDFYTGKGASSSSGISSQDGKPLPPKDAGGNISFYLDVRPAVNDWESLKTRAAKWVGV